MTRSEHDLALQRHSKVRGVTLTKEDLDQLWASVPGDPADHPIEMIEIILSAIDKLIPNPLNN